MENNPKRLSREDYQRLMTFFCATRGTCNRLRTATTLWSEEGKPISNGYNGSLPGDAHCDDIGHLMEAGHCIRTLHGEENAIINADDLSRLKNSIARILGRPCYRCAKALIAVGVKKIEFLGDYPSLGGNELEELCRKHNVELNFIRDFNFLKVLNQALEFLQGPGGPLKDFPKIKILLEGEEPDDK